MLKAVNGVTKSDGGDVRGTWLQLMCCTLPKTSVSLIYLRVEDGDWLEVVGVGLEVLY